MSTTSLSNQSGDLDSCPRNLEPGPAQLLSRESGLTSKAPDSAGHCGSAISPQDVDSANKASAISQDEDSADYSADKALRSSTRRQVHRKRPAQRSAEENEIRKQRRLEKNRVTAAVSRSEAPTFELQI